MPPQLIAAKLAVRPSRGAACARAQAGSRGASLASSYLETAYYCSLAKLLDCNLANPRRNSTHELSNYFAGLL